VVAQSDDGIAIAKSIQRDDRARAQMRARENDTSRNGLSWSLMTFVELQVLRAVDPAVQITRPSATPAH
jgi:hypothetical protein